MIGIKTSGSFDNTNRFLAAMANMNQTVASLMQRQGQVGVNALAAATPYSTGLAAHSWNYEVEVTATGCALIWTNSDVESGFPVVIRLQYGYATGTGGYVQGRDFINPVVKPIFDQIANDIWRAVTTA